MAAANILAVVGIGLTDRHMAPWYWVDRQTDTPVLYSTCWYVMGRVQ